MINEESDKCSNIVLNSMIFSLIRDIIYTSSDPKNREDARKDYVNYICEKLAEDELTIQEAIYLKEKIDDKIISDVYYKIASHYKEEIRRKFPQLKRSNIPKKIRDEVLRRDKYTCQYCGVRLSDTVGSYEVAHVDHVKSVRTGGKTKLSNLVAACWRCNLGKSDYDIFVFADDDAD